MKFNSVGRLCCHVTLALTLLAADARGQAERDRELDAQWGAVQALPAGEAIQVGLIKKESVRGNIVSSTEMTVTVATKGGEVSTARSDIKEVKVKRGQNDKELNRRWNWRSGGSHDGGDSRRCFDRWQRNVRICCGISGCSRSRSGIPGVCSSAGIQDNLQGSLAGECRSAKKWVGRISGVSFRRRSERAGIPDRDVAKARSLGTSRLGKFLLGGFLSSVSFATGAELCHREPPLWILVSLSLHDGMGV